MSYCAETDEYYEDYHMPRNGDKQRFIDDDGIERDYVFEDGYWHSYKV